MDKKVQKKSKIMTQELGSELMLYDTKGDLVHVLNETAKVIWQGMMAGRTEDAIVSELQQRFSIESKHDLMSDIRDTINGFREKGLLRGK